MKVSTKHVTGAAIAAQLSAFAVEALTEEVCLTPKPGLVDTNNNGSHHDLTLEIMHKSARALKACFYDMSLASFNQEPSPYLRERLGAIGRYGEEQMLKATGGVNTHKGAIWALGLITGAASSLLAGEAGDCSAAAVLHTAGLIASYHDRFVPPQQTHGSEVRKFYPVRSAREEAALGFPSLVETALPAWERYAQESEGVRRLNVLLALMATVDDTCILHRSNMIVLREIQEQCRTILQQGGLAKAGNWQAYIVLDHYITSKWVSPGGSADLLAATIFINKITEHFKINS